MNPLREAAQRQLTGIKGAFLRCDRGEALYITNAALRSQREIDWAEAGFEACMKGRMTFLVPKDEAAAAFEAWLYPRVAKRFLYEHVSNADFGLVEEADRRLWIEGVKQLEMRTKLDYEKAVRQRAAVCLRQRVGGGTIRVCALIADALREMNE